MCKFLILLENRKRIKKQKNQNFQINFSEKILKDLPLLSQLVKKVLDEINLDLKSSSRMFRIIQGDVGSGKTIVSLLSIANVIESNYQCALMAPTEILAKQHYNLAKKILRKLILI